MTDVDKNTTKHYFKKLKSGSWAPEGGLEGATRDAFAEERAKMALEQARALAEEEWADGLTPSSSRKSNAYT